MRKLSVLMIVILGSAITGIPPISFAQDSTSILSNLKTKYDGQEFAFSADVANNGPRRLRARVCVRLLDKDNFEVAIVGTDDLNLAVGGTTNVTSSTQLLPRPMNDVVMLHAYIGPYGCVSTEGDALSNILVQPLTH